MAIDSTTTDRPYGVAPRGFRLPGTTAVGAVTLQVSDLERSLTYYRDVLGFAVLSSSASAADLGAHGEARPLVRLRTAAGVRPARRGALGLYHFAVLLPDRAALGRFAAHLAANRMRAGMADHLVSEAFYLWDPDGLGIEVYADRPREAWQHRGRELVMTTDSLDVDSVIEAGLGQPWQGMPRGTAIGHVHLHVGTLEEAERFYHSALGFEKMVWSYPGALFLAAGGYHHHLGTNIWSSAPAARDDEARLMEWEIVVPDEATAMAAAASVREAGYTADGTDRTCLAADPWGTHVRVRSRG